MKTRTSPVGNKGFTLLELLIVLFIAGMAIAVVSFSVSRAHEKAIFNDEVRQLFQTAQRARQLSLLDRKEIILRIDSDEARYWLETEDASVIIDHRLRQGLSISGKDIEFLPLGNSSGGDIVIKNNRDRGFIIEIDSVLATPTLKRL